jgi:hypothetical protein
MPDPENAMHRHSPLPSFAAALLATTAAALAPAARAQEPVAEMAAPRAVWVPSLSAGYGAAYDTAGLSLEVRRGHWAAFLGLGSDAFTAPPDSGVRGRGLGSLSLGARWFSGDGEHLVLSLHAMGTAWDGWQTHSVGQQGRALFGGTAGWRQKLGGTFFAQAAVGAAAKYESYDVQLATARPVSGWSAVPDVDVGVGMSF